MIREKTLFVIGAGGSFELGLPLGQKLKSQIAEKFAFKFRHGQELVSGDRDVWDGIKFIRDQNEPLESYRQAAVSIADAMPIASSIDNYIHAHGHDQTIEKVAKLGIAACILEGERKSKLFDDHVRNKRFSLEGVSDSWLLRLHQMLTEDVTKSNVENCLNSVSFIIFNYDRCIEHFLARSLEVYFRLPEKRAQEIVSKGRFFHPYGQVGALSWQSGETIPFGFDFDGRALATAASGIRTFTEGVSDADLTQEIRHEIETSKCIVFLGFAYHKMNLTLLNHNKKPELTKLFGSAVGMSDANLGEIKCDLAKIFVQTHGVGFEDAYIASHILLHQNLTCSTLLDYYYRVLTK